MSAENLEQAVGYLTESIDRLLVEIRGDLFVYLGEVIEAIKTQATPKLRPCEWTDWTGDTSGSRSINSGSPSGKGWFHCYTDEGFCTVESKDGTCSHIAFSRLRFTDREPENETKEE